MGNKHSSFVLRFIPRVRRHLFDVLDEGISCALEIAENGDVHMVQTSIMKGTVLYSAKIDFIDRISEKAVWIGIADENQRVDLYVFYRLSTGDLLIIKKQRHTYNTYTLLVRKSDIQPFLPTGSASADLFVELYNPSGV